MRRAVLVSGAVLAFVAGCGGSDSTGAQGANPNTLSWETGDFDVPAGESFTCFYTDIVTAKELSVLSASAQQGKGGHHVTIYYVDNKRPVKTETCSGTSEMVDWHFVVGAGGEGNQLDNVVRLADGLAIKIPEGKQLMVQAHYINTTGAAAKRNDKIELHLTDPTKVSAYAADFVIDDDAWTLPPHEQLTSTMTCTVAEDTKLVMLLGHEHEHGVHYSLEKLDDKGASLEMLYDEAWKPEYSSHPPIHFFTTAEPLVLPAGTRLKQTCSWNNTSDQMLAFPTEMCIGFGYYFPGTSRRQCEPDATP